MEIYILVGIRASKPKEILGAFPSYEKADKTGRAALLLRGFDHFEIHATPFEVEPVLKFFAFDGRGFHNEELMAAHEAALVGAFVDKNRSLAVIVDALSPQERERFLGLIRVAAQRLPIRLAYGQPD